MFSALLLGIIQGLTEFLPVSSSGHLVLFGKIFPVVGDHVLFDLVVHLGTLVPVFIVYRADILAMLKAPFVEKGPLAERPNTRLALLVVLGTVPTGIIGLTFKDTFEALFSGVGTLGITFAITGVLLLSTRLTLAPANPGQGLFSGLRERLSSRVPTTASGLAVWHVLVIGIAQGLAITPGISRSGTTIAVALFLGLERELAARFSFLLAIPAICGAFVLTAKDANVASLDFGVLGVGFVASMLSGYGALVLLVKLVKRGDFAWFAPYLFALAALAGAAGLGWIQLPGGGVP